MGKLWHRKTSTAEVYVSTPNDLSEVVAQTTTPLGPNGVWVSDDFETLGWGLVVGSVFADAPGTLRVQFSNDGTNWDAEEDFAYTAGSRMGFVVDVCGRWARIRYENGATAQTVFRLIVRMRRW